MKRFLDLFRVREEMLLTHVPVQTDQESKEGRDALKARNDKLAAAKAKHRKPFATEVRKERETEPSIVLVDIQRQVSEEKSARRPALAKVAK